MDGDGLSWGGINVCDSSTVQDIIHQKRLTEGTSETLKLSSVITRKSRRLTSVVSHKERRRKGTEGDKGSATEAQLMEFRAAWRGQGSADQQTPLE